MAVSAVGLIVKRLYHSIDALTTKHEEEVKEVQNKLHAVEINYQTRYDAREAQKQIMDMLKDLSRKLDKLDDKIDMKVDKWAMTLKNR